MIELVTGLPGNGKTLYTISQVKKQAERENRPVFYHGIPELTLNWELLDDPKEWAKVPPRSIVVIDEGQKTFRNRSLGSVPPPFVTELETHRHLGIDLVIITQHPSLIDPAVRRLAGRHTHLVRVWGTQASTVHKWDAVKDNCDKARADSEKTRWSFDKAMFGVYKSAEVHTMKRSIPGRVKLLIGCLVALAALAYGAVHLIGNRLKPQDAQSSSSPLQSAQTGFPVASNAQAPFDPMLEAQKYVYAQTPRIENLPQTAPKYDELTKPDTVPVPAMCIRRGQRCQCYTQQATKMNIPMNQCLDIAYNGYFQEFDPTPNKRNDQPVAQQSQPAHVEQTPSRVLSFADSSPSVPVAPPVVEEATDKPRPQRRAVAANVL